MINRKSFGIFSFISCLTYPVTAFAWVSSSLKTYTVWNQFDATVEAFRTLGLLMSDARYQGLFFGIVVLGIVVGGGASILSAYTGKSPLGSFIRWFGVVLIGVILYLTFIKPTTSIIIYDEATNQMTSVAGIPEGIVFLAGISNQIEAGFVDIISIASDPMSYRNDAGGLTFTIFNNLFNGGVNMSGDTSNTEVNLYRSLQKYFSDCVFFEMGLPSAKITPNDFNNTSDFRTILAKANNPAIYTTYYNAANPGGTCLSCQNAWTSLNSDFSNMNNTSMPVSLYWSNRCAAAGLGTSATGSSETAICQNKAQGAMNNIFGSAFSASQIFRQFFVTRMMWDVFTFYSNSNAVQALSSRTAGSSMVGMGIMANKWIPVMRGIVFSIFIGLLPFLCLMIPTPLFTKVISFIFGIFIFFACWTICDALVNGFAVGRAMDVFREIQTGQLGYTSMLLFSSAAEKSLAMFGAARWMAVLLAGLMSGMLTKFGGVALVHFTQGLASSRQHGAAAAESVSNSSKWASSIKGMEEVYPSMTYANSSFNAVAGSGVYSATKTLKEASGMAGQFGGSYSKAGKAMGDANTTSNLGAIGNSNAVKSYAAEHKMSVGAVQQAIQNFAVDSKGGSALALQNLSRSLGTKPQSTMDFIKSVGMNQEYGQVLGLQQGFDNAREHNGFTGSMSDYVGMQASVQHMKGFADAAAIEKFSKNYSGGAAGFLKDQAEFRTSQVESQLATIKEHGATPEQIGTVLGELDGIRNMVDSDVFQRIGEPGVVLTRSGEQYNELSKFIMRKAGNEIMTKGQISGDTQKMLNLMQKHSDSAAQLKAHEGSGITMAVSSGKEAQNLAHWINSTGGHANAKDLVGSTVSMSMVEQNGQLGTSTVVSKEGQQVYKSNSHFTDTSTQTVSGEKSVNYGGQPGNYGGTNLVAMGSLEYIGHGNNRIATLNGIDFKGNEHNMTMLVNGNDPSEWITQHDHVTSSGKTYKGNLINTALNMREDDEVFQDRSAGVVFSNELASQMSKVISKTEGNKDAHEIVNSWTASVGARFNSSAAAVAKGISQATGLSIDGSINANHRSIHSKQNSTSSNRDVIAAAYRKVSLSNLPDQEKREMIQDMTRYFLGDRDLPGLSPERPGANIALAGKNSMGERWNASPDYKAPIIPPDPKLDPNAKLMQYDHDHDPNQLIRDMIEINPTDSNNKDD